MGRKNLRKSYHNNLFTFEFQKGKKCKNTWRQEKDIKFQYNGCTSVKEYRPKYCATCKRSRCCVPEKTKTNAMEWECDGKLVVHDFMWIKSCVCTDDCPDYKHENIRHQKEN